MTTTAIGAPQETRLRCMEISGGNRAVNNALSIPGIDAWIYSQPFAGDESGGDIHYVSLCGGNKIARFAVADVSGHGAEVGAVAARLRRLMGKNINKVDQTRFIRALNKGFTDLTKDGTFATALLTTYFGPTDHLITCNAGHPPPLWYRASQKRWRLLDHKLEEASTSIANIPLGIINPTEYYQFAVKLEKGDLVVICTDWLIEAANPDGVQLGAEGVLEMVHRIDAGEPEAFARSLLAAVTEYRGGAPANDDVTVVVLHHNGERAPRQSMGEMIRVVGKMLGLVKI